VLHVAAITPPETSIPVEGCGLHHVAMNERNPGTASWTNCTDGHTRSAVLREGVHDSSNILVQLSALCADNSTLERRRLRKSSNHRLCKPCAACVRFFAAFGARVVFGSIMQIGTPPYCASFTVFSCIEHWWSKTIRLRFRRRCGHCASCCSLSAHPQASVAASNCFK
jgi:hypothetical protein